jgi:hypothetical protein
MELLNATRMHAGYTLGLEPSGRELLVIVVKGTFRLPRSGAEAGLHDVQVPLTTADTFTGLPGASAPEYEIDFAPRKLRCDVLVLGSAYAPAGRAVARTSVGLRIGDWKKSFSVVGNRTWRSGLGGIRATEPAPFVSQRISYDVAFGGIDARDANPARHAVFMPNPVGRGFRARAGGESLDGQPLPNTEEHGRPVTTPWGPHAPMAFGPVGRAWEPRIRYAGTYGDDWLSNQSPFLPSDFDDQYFQAAPLDQQLPLRRSSQEVVLVNLTPDGARSFNLPAFDAPIHVFPRKGGREDHLGVLDTVVLEPDLERFTMTWRFARPLRKNMLEISQVLVGRKSRGWWRARELGKVYYPSLSDLPRKAPAARPCE